MRQGRQIRIVQTGALINVWAWAIFLQQLINGLTLGSIYGLIALGYTMVYGIVQLINFAHGEIYMIGAFRQPDRVSRD